MKFLGISILISAILLSGAIVVNALFDRYTIVATSNYRYVLDKFTGDYYKQNNESVKGYNPIIDYKNSR